MCCFNQGNHSSFVSKTGPSALNNNPSHDRNIEAKKRKKSQSKTAKKCQSPPIYTEKGVVRVPEICCRPERVAEGILIVLVVSVSWSLVFRAFDAIETATKVSFGWQSNDKGAFSHGDVDGRAKRHRRALPFPMAALPRVLCDRRFVRGTIQRWVFWLCGVVCGRERSKGESDLLGMVGLTCQREIIGPRARQPVLQERGGGAGGKKGPENGAERYA